MMRLLGILLLALLPCFAQALELNASVDRTRLDEGDTLELALESDDVAQFGKPDLSALDTQFDVLGTRQVNRLAVVNGETRQVTRWIVTLQPKQTGYVVVPPLRLGDASSQPITLYIEPAGSSGSAKMAPVYIDASVDREKVYVQAQLVLTLRIYHSVPLYDDSSLTPLQMDDARVEPLGEPRTYEKEIGGVRHGVIEMRYAIFPQQSGALKIPPLAFSATLVENAPNSGLLPFGSHSGRLTRVKSPEIPLQVLPKPASYPADAPWLPASALSLSEAWSPEPTEVKVGDSLTRNLILRAEGLSSAQLPPIGDTRSDALRRYPDQPRLANQSTDSSLVGSREQSEALVPIHSGGIDLPALEVVWWNTTEDRLERTALPERHIEVVADPLLEAPALPPADAPQATEYAAPLWPWQLLSALLACTTLLGFGLWWHARRQPAVQRVAPTGPSPRTLLDDLKRACLANDTQATRQALDAWARQQPETLADMAARFTPLSDALDGLNGSLYSETGQHWQGEDLWLAIRTLPPAEAAATPQEPSPLPPLYPR
ncbi:BatD family protein [Pseudomonas sp. UBA6310]|uniref:BatD family protein n=1 Tax=Pseudomonas sp. UBA6310 TaxID=1947327 RepID=UPI00257DE4BF|nr:protein BatD [Pseudomonas sp. UBA6310]